MIFKPIYNFFHNKPVIGIVAGTSTSISLHIHDLLTDETLLKEAAGLGVIMGAAVATVSFFTGMIRLVDIVHKRFKNKRNETPKVG